MPDPLPLKIFLASFKYVPRLAVSLVVENNRGEVLLARRAIPPEKGSWHMPGAFVLKNEPIRDCIKRIAHKEFDLTIRPTSVRLLGLFDDIHNDPRGHVVDAVYRLKVSEPPKLTKETRELKFFRKLPRVIGFNHGKTLRGLGYR